MAVLLGRHSDRLTALRALHSVKGRREQRRFAFEGPTLLKEAIAAGFPIQELYATQASYESVGGIRELEADGVPVYLVGPESAATISATASPSGLVAVGPARLLSAAELVGPQSLLLVMADLNDPANAGTLLRSADAFGCHGVLCGSLGIDPYHPKVVRGAMGAIFRLPLALAEPDSVMAAARNDGVRVLGLSADGRNVASQEWARPLALVVGNERHGLGRWSACCHGFVAIPMRHPTESLSAGVAGSIALFVASWNELPAKSQDYRC